MNFIIFKAGLIQEYNEYTLPGSFLSHSVNMNKAYYIKLSKFFL